MGLCRWRLEERFARGWRHPPSPRLRHGKEGRGQTAEDRGQREDCRLKIFQAGKEEGNETPEKNNEMESKECCVLSLDFKLRSAGFRPLLHFAQPIQHV